jgi:hypothetical protein
MRTAVTFSSVIIIIIIIISMQCEVKNAWSYTSNPPSRLNDVLLCEAK